MAADYYLNVYDTSGTRQFVVTDYASLSYTRRVNAPGLLQIGLRGDHPLLAVLADKWQVEVFRRPAGGNFARDFVGLARQEEFYYGEASTAALTLPGLMSMLAWRIVAYAAGAADLSEFIATAGETIAKTLVSYNAGANATTGNGRIRTGTISGLLVEADGAGGNSLDWYCAKANLLETLQDLAPLAGGDFDLVKTDVDEWQFRWYTGQLGTNRTATVKFSIELGNMGNPQYRHIRVDEKTVAIAGGPGEEAEREIVVRTGTNYAAGNDIEMFVNATDCDTTAGLEARGDAYLEESRARQEFSFDVLQTPACAYGAHYFLGDLVTAINPFTGAALTMKIEGVSISVSESGEENINVSMAVQG